MILWPAGVLHAQESPVVEVGTRVRVTAATVAPDRIVATLVALDEKTMTLAVGPQRTPLVVPRDGITRLEVSRGRQANVGKGMLVGAIPWVILVGLVVHAGGLAESGIVGGGSFAVLGIGVAAGAGIGATIKTERWQDATASPPGRSVSTLGGRRVACSFTLSF